jgi:hypothetical protein
MGVPTRVVALRHQGDWRYMLGYWTCRTPNDVAEAPPAPFEEPKLQRMKRFWRANWIDASRSHKISFLISAEDRGHADEVYEMLAYGYGG